VTATPLARGDDVAPGYPVLELLSRSDALDVYDAWSAERSCRCVVKVVRPDRPRPAGARRRLVQEGQILLAASHPHLVRAYELVEEPVPALVLETIDGETLGALIERLRRRLPAAEIAHLGLHICSAVAYLHRRGWLHLDLKSSNVVANAGVARVIDLSVARRPGLAPAEIGTAQYLSPEQAAGGELDEAADVWGIGAVLYEAATGEPPFPASRPGAYEQLGGLAPRVGSLRRLPRPLAELIDGCLDRAPRARPTTDQLAATLTPLAPGAPSAVVGCSPAAMA
jgi:eukaryotic-like serine/threonine-protein kinase